MPRVCERYAKGMRKIAFPYRAILSFGLSRLIVWLEPFDRLARAKKTGGTKKPTDLRDSAVTFLFEDSDGRTRMKRRSRNFGTTLLMFTPSA